MNIYYKSFFLLLLLGALVVISFFVTKFSVLFLIAFFGVVGVVFLFLYPRWGIYFLLGSLVAGQLIRLPLPVGEGGILISDTLTGLLLVSWIFKKLLLKEKFTLSFLAVPITGFIIVAFISLLINSTNLTSDELMASGFYLIRWIEYAGIYFVVSDLFPRSLPPEKHSRYILSILLVGIIIALLGFAQLLIFPDFSPMVKYGWDPHEGRLLSTWFDPNFVGGFLSIMLVTVIAFVLFFKRKEVVNPADLIKLSLLVLGIGVLFIALVLTYSRSSYLAFLFGFSVIIALFLLRVTDKNRFIKICSVGVVTMVVIISAIVAFPRAQNRIQGARNLDVTAQARLESWKQTWNAIEDNYIIGLGYNTLRYNQAISVSKLHSASGSDSSLLTIWLTTGILGVVFYGWILTRILKKSVSEFLNKNNPPIRRALGLAIVGTIFIVLIHSMFVNSLLYPHTMLVFWLLVGLL